MEKLKLFVSKELNSSRGRDLSTVFTHKGCAMAGDGYRVSIIEDVNIELKSSDIQRAMGNIYFELQKEYKDAKEGKINKDLKKALTAKFRELKASREGKLTKKDCLIGIDFTTGQYEVYAPGVAKKQKELIFFNLSYFMDLLSFFKNYKELKVSFKNAVSAILVTAEETKRHSILLPVRVMK